MKTIVKAPNGLMVGAPYLLARCGIASAHSCTPPEPTPPGPTPPPLQPDWNADAVTFGFMPGQVTAQSKGVNYEQTPTQPQAGSMLLPEPDDLVKISVMQVEQVMPGDPFLISGSIASAPNTYENATYEVFDSEGTLLATGGTSYDHGTNTLNLLGTSALINQPWISSKPVYVTITKA